MVKTTANIVVNIINTITINQQQNMFMREAGRPNDLRRRGQSSQFPLLSPNWTVLRLRAE